ncbi:hypothetical protein [Kitasatospora sp. NPDC087315]|uniref:hypothetical protein n=1 Tax=Kitasatospora sp. NPDC087315 TaxID=3364069 RepID=UPI0037FA3752
MPQPTHPGRGDIADCFENLLTTKETPMPDQTPAQIAYQAYGDTTGGLNHLGKPMPAWDDLPDTIRTAWAAAATAAAQHGILVSDPEYPATLAGGHALILQYGDCEFITSCQCGHDIATHRPDQLDLNAIATAWEHHVIPS